jgi:hypothetical protein
MLELVLVLVVGLVAGLVVALGYIAPKTETKKDDELLALLEKYGMPVVTEVKKWLVERK